MAPTPRSVATFFALLAAPILYFGRRNLPSPPLPVVPPLVPAIHRLQQYLRIRTDHPNPAYLDAQFFLNQTVAALLPDATFSTHTFVQGKPIVLITLQGTNPQLPSLLLNSHTDVVPSEESQWDWPPYAAHTVLKDAQLRIYARGSQDMKSVGMQYIEALAQLSLTGWRPKRTVFISFVPDEEVGGADGMGKLVHSTLFQAMNVGVALDEGLPRNDAKFNCYYGERQTWWLSLNVTDRPGHGSNLPKTTAAATLNQIIHKAMQFRKRQLQRLESGVDMGHIVGVNIAYLKYGHPDENMSAGFTMNVISSLAQAGFDIRVPPTIDATEVDKEIQSWIACDDDEPCPGVSIEWVIKVQNTRVTSRDPQRNPYAASFMRGLEKAGIAHNLNHGIFQAATDARYLRAKGVPCFGFSPIDTSPNLLHKHNEYLPVDTYLQGIRIYQSIIREMADDHQQSSDSDTCDLRQDKQDVTRQMNKSGEKEEL